MRLSIYLIPFVVLLINAGYSNFQNTTNYENNVINIEKYTISIPEHFIDHTKGFSPGLGSSITMKKILNTNHIQLYAICDRGPNYTIAAPKGHSSTIIFPAPKFSPFIGVIDIVKGKSATLSDVITLKMDHQPITGIPTPSAQYKIPSLPIPADLNFKFLQPDIRGVDPESLDVDSEGNFWIGEEYGPRIFKANNSGDILEIYSTENGLPEILKNGLLNRGFESLAIAPNGKIYAIMESILDVEGKTKSTANFMRMIELDPISGQTRTLAYPFDQDTYINNVSVKIGDLAAIDDTHFLLVEQGPTKLGMRNIIYMIDISKATDISDIDLPKECILNSSNIRCVEKIKLLDPREYNWPHEKLEGIAILNENTIILTHDNDFGFSLSINDINSQDVEDYTVDYATQKLLKNGIETSDKVKIDLDENADSWLWIVTFKKSLVEFFADFKSSNSTDLDLYDQKLENKTLL